MAVCLALTMVRSVAVPAWLGGAVTTVAASAYYVYIANPAVVYLFNSRAGLAGGHPILCIVSSFGAGVLLHRVAAELLARMRRRRVDAPAGARGLST
jgi:hypothetical protein